MVKESDSYNDRQKVWELIKDINIALLVTTSKEGPLHGRPMAAMNKDFNGELWFASRDGTPKLDEIAESRSFGASRSGSGFRTDRKTRRSR